MMNSSLPELWAETIFIDREDDLAIAAREAAAEVDRLKAIAAFDRGEWAIPSALTYVGEDAGESISLQDAMALCGDDLKVALATKAAVVAVDYDYSIEIQY